MNVHKLISPNKEQEALVVKKSVEVERQHLEADVKAKADAEKYKKET